MKNIHLNSKFTHKNRRNLLGVGFLTLFAISIFSYSDIGERAFHLLSSSRMSISGVNLLGIGWLPVFIGLFGYYPYMMFKQKHKAEKLRMKLASDLHDDLGSILNSVNIYTDLALIKGEATYLHKIKESTQDAINGVRNIIWQLDDTDTSFSNLVARINNFAAFLCQVKQIRFKIEIGKDSFTYELHEEEKRNLYMIIKEAINNSVKYANATEIMLCINIDKGKPVITIQDDGKGYNQACGISGNGIRNMKARACAIRYDIDIQSTTGTIIQLHKK